MHNELFGYIISIDSVPEDEEYIPMMSANLNEIVQRMQLYAISKTKKNLKAGASVAGNSWRSTTTLAKAPSLQVSTSSTTISSIVILTAGILARRWE